MAFGDAIIAKRFLSVSCSIIRNNSVANLKKKIHNMESSTLGKSELKQHIVFHLKEKPFQCGSCDKRFAKKDSLSNHLKRHVGIVLPKRYECKICHNK